MMGWVLLVSLGWLLACGESTRNHESGTLTTGSSVGGGGTQSGGTSDAGGMSVVSFVSATSMGAAVASESVGATSVGGAGAGGAGGTGAAGAAGFSCTNPNELEVGGVPTGIYACGEGYEVRQDLVTCPNLMPPKGAGGAPGDGQCTSDADCPGREFCQSYPSGQFCIQGCQNDADCGPGFVCRCDDPIGVCEVASCATTEDCEPGAFCAAVHDSMCMTSYEYACQSEEDLCQTDQDCIDQETGDWCILVEDVRRCDTKLPCR